MKPKRALILVDLQNDFVPGGALAVPDGDAVVPVANKVQQAFDLIVATQDWHPRDHGSFAANHRGKLPGDVVNLNGLRQILWPVHCVQNTRGADFVPGLNLSRVKKIFHKGIDPWIDSYSCFFDNGHRRDTGLNKYLKSQGVRDVYLMGLATDYCVKFSVLDALQLGFNVHVIEDGCRGINLKRDDSEETLEQLRRAGVEITRSSRVLSSGKSKVKPLRTAVSRAKRKVVLRKRTMARKHA
jgi:nicotinamidase/pyrazinamidase